MINVYSLVPQGSKDAVGVRFEFTNLQRFFDIELDLLLEGILTIKDDKYFLPNPTSVLTLYKTEKVVDGGSVYWVMKTEREIKKCLRDKFVELKTLKEVENFLEFVIFITSKCQSNFRFHVFQGTTLVHSVDIRDVYPSTRTVEYVLRKPDSHNEFLTESYESFFSKYPSGARLLKN